MKFIPLYIHLDAEIYVEKGIITHLLSPFILAI